MLIISIIGIFYIITSGLFFSLCNRVVSFLEKVMLVLFMIWGRESVFLVLWFVLALILLVLGHSFYILVNFVSFRSKFLYFCKKKKLKQSCYRPGVAQSVPGS